MFGRRYRDMTDRVRKIASTPCPVPAPCRAILHTLRRFDGGRAEERRAGENEQRDEGVRRVCKIARDTLEPRTAWGDFAHAVGSLAWSASAIVKKNCSALDVWTPISRHDRSRAQNRVDPVPGSGALQGDFAHPTTLRRW